MKIKDRLSAILILSVLLLLVIDSKTALKSCAEGIELCLQNVIPALFPFLVLAPMMISYLSFGLPKALRRMIKLPKGADGLLVAGLLGGYPTGAQCIAFAAQNKNLSVADANRLMAFCCNCGPGFVFGLCGSLFSWHWAALGLWLCHIAGALIVGWLIPGECNSNCTLHRDKTNLTQAVTKAIKAMAQICSWVIIFRCMLGFLRKWLLCKLNIHAAVLITGILEMTNGCLALEQIGNCGLRFAICEAIISIGGLCVAMQTASVIKPTKMGLYIPGKLAHCFISTLLAAAVWTIHTKNWLGASVLAGVILAILAAAKTIAVKKENYSRNLSPSIV